MPTVNPETKPCKRTALLKAGVELMLQKGYAGTGVQEILKAVDMPKGCFYHYFESKEQYALELIRYLDHQFTTLVLPVLKDTNRAPLQRLRDYTLEAKTVLYTDAEKGGCAISALCQEMSDQSEVLRTELSSVLYRWRAALTDCIAEGQEIGEIRTDCEAMHLAELFASAMIGSVIRAKTIKSREPVEIVLHALLEKCLNR